MRARLNNRSPRWWRRDSGAAAALIIAAFAAATFCGSLLERYARKSHVYVFQDDKEWREFVKQARQMPWSHSFAIHDELFLNIHGTGQGFESDTLAHETTHAVVARVYGSARWPLWLSEGFAEYMADACGAVRRGLAPEAYPRHLGSATMTLTELIACRVIPRILRVLRNCMIPARSLFVISSPNIRRNCSRDWLIDFSMALRHSSRWPRFMAMNSATWLRSTSDFRLPFVKKLISQIYLSKLIFPPGLKHLSALLQLNAWLHG